MDITIIPFLVMAVSIYAYACYVLKLMGHLEANHRTELEKMDFPKKISRFCYYSTPSTAKNFIKFIYSKNNLSDPEIEALKSKIRITIALFLVSIISGTLLCLRMSK